MNFLEKSPEKRAGFSNFIMACTIVFDFGHTVCLQEYLLLKGIIKLLNLAKVPEIIYFKSKPKTISRIMAFSFFV